MFSLQKLLGKEDLFFDLLEDSAEESRASVQALIRFVKNPDQVKSLDEFILSRRKEKKIADEISEALCKTFVTALEREDIDALSFALYRIPKTMEKIGERILIAPKLMQGIDLTRQILLLEKATDTVVKMLKELRAGAGLDRIRAENDRLQVVEGEADRLMLELLKDLYTGNHAASQALFLKDVYELLEKVADRCRDAGNIIDQSMLKNS